MASKRSVLLAMFVTAVAPLASKAMAEEALVDGVRFAAPDGTGFFLPPPNGGITRAADVQAMLDRNRAAGPRREGASILFTTLSIPGKPLVAVLAEPRADHPFNVRRNRMRALPRTDGVASVPRELSQSDDPSLRWYIVDTGLDYAPDAVMSCGLRSDGKEACLMSLTLDGRLRMTLRAFPIDESTHAGIRKGVVEAVNKTLPDGVRRR